MIVSQLSVAHLMFLSRLRLLVFSSSGKVIASCLPPFETKGLTSEDVNGLLDKVRSAMQAEFKKISMEMEERAEIAGNSLLVEWTIR